MKTVFLSGHGGAISETVDVDSLARFFQTCPRSLTAYDSNSFEPFQWLLASKSY
ncbi:MAG: hypothetical protein ABSE95_11785 [Thermodesulfobacteriota bacterium]|jgi:hypothetical protein